MNRKLWGAVVLCAGAAAVVGCDDITTDGLGGSGGGTGGSTTVASSSSSTSTSSASTTASSSTGGGSCEAPPGDGVTTCADACQTLFDCGLQVCTGADQLCVNFSSDPNAAMPKVTEASWHGGGNNGCDAQCNAAGLNNFLAIGIDPKDCATTINTWKTNAITMGSFKPACDGP